MDGASRIAEMGGGAPDPVGRSAAGRLPVLPGDGDPLATDVEPPPGLGLLIGCDIRLPTQVALARRASPIGLQGRHDLYRRTAR